MIRRLLVANRGEIALRIIRACREMGIAPIAVYSDADAAAPHVLAADRAVGIGPAPAAESYLAIGRLIDAARDADADAVHPGYGFLAESAVFAEACADAHLTFVGPPAEAIARMGSKIEARRLMAAAGIPVVPGATPGDQSDAGVAAAARRVGVPVVIKAAAGGGGRGMRVVRDPAGLEQAVASARREAAAAFGDGTLYVERLLERPRHVELQVLADHHGGLVHLFERECSVQRRHQKIVEESPSPVVTPELRRLMGEAAIAAARTVGYTNAGTVELLVEPGAGPTSFYFLEMNTRLQVEHPLTEMVTGTDLVRAQIAIAAGEPLPWRQEMLSQRGHAIECRVYAEDPAGGFLPQAGRILLYREPAGPGIRVDAGCAEGTEVPVHYDALLAKLVAHGETREIARARALAALRRFAVLGVRTNLSFLRRILEHEAFRSGTADTGFVDAELDSLLATPPPPPEAAAAAAWHVTRAAGPATPDRAGGTTAADPWATLKGWRL